MNREVSAQRCVGSGIVSNRLGSPKNHGLQRVATTINDHCFAGVHGVGGTCGTFTGFQCCAAEIDAHVANEEYVFFVERTIATIKVKQANFMLGVVEDRDRGFLAGRLVAQMTVGVLMKTVSSPLYTLRQR